MRLYRWRPFEGENLGDWLSVPILRALGHEPEPPASDEPVLFAIGSILHPAHYQASGCSRIVVWGSGAVPDVPAGVELDFRAVRGPISRAMFNLPDLVPTGDPALLLPQLVTLPEPSHRGEDLYINHMNAPAGELPGAMAITAHTTADEALSLVARIAAARFVASESLHGCIVAAAYGVPWAPCSVRWGSLKISWQCKHNDWLAYLGIPPIDRLPTTLAAAKEWWEAHGRRGVIRNIDRLLDAFPHSLNEAGPWMRTAPPIPIQPGTQTMKRRLDEGVLEDVEQIASIHWAVSDQHGENGSATKYLPYVRIVRKDGTEMHVHAADEPMANRPEAAKLAKERAEKIIAAATSPA